MLPKQKAAGPASKGHVFESNSRKCFRSLNKTSHVPGERQKDTAEEEPNLFPVKSPVGLEPRPSTSPAHHRLGALCHGLRDVQLASSFTAEFCAVPGPSGRAPRSWGNGKCRRSRNIGFPALPGLFATCTCTCTFQQQSTAHLFQVFVLCWGQGGTRPLGRVRQARCL